MGVTAAVVYLTCEHVVGSTALASEQTVVSIFPILDGVCACVVNLED